MRNVKYIYLLHSHGESFEISLHLFCFLIIYGSYMTNSLQTLLYSEIPLTKTIGICVEQYDKNALTLSAPLENNINHKNTAFGGSLYCVSVLSGWGLVHMLLKEQGLSGHIVIQESNTQFIKPVTGEIFARSAFNSDEQINSFVKMFKRKGIARIELDAVVSCDLEICVKFHGKYVVHT